MWKPHALELMKQAPDVRGVGEYLAWGVEVYHDKAEMAAMDASFVHSGVAYRDALIDRIFDRAKHDGHEDVLQSLEKFRLRVRLAKPETWWIVEKKR